MAAFLCNGAVYGQHTPMHLQHTTTFMRDIDFKDPTKGDAIVGNFLVTKGGI